MTSEPIETQSSAGLDNGNISFHHTRAKEFIDLHDQVQTSITLLDSLESFLSTFQKDLSAVSGEISELQDRSKDIEKRLKHRKRIEKPLSNLVSDITIPPSLATLILDSEVGEPWISAIEDFEKRLETTKARSKVRAARDLSEVIEGLRIAAATKLRAFFLVLFQPIRSSVTTNMQVMQTSVLLKFRLLFAFLQRQAPDVAHEIQRSYIGAARVYYETGFRRYIRSLGWIKARTTEKNESIVLTERESTLEIDHNRLAYAKIEGPSVTLAFMGDDKTHKEHIEALLRSLMLVLMDNATAEYTFINTFFSVEPPPVIESEGSIMSPAALLSPDQGSFVDIRSTTGSDYGMQHGTDDAEDTGSGIAVSGKSDHTGSDSIWKQVLDPVLDYCRTFVNSSLEPIPPVIPLLTMIRLTEAVVAETQKRVCPPLESFVFALRLQMWPVFQKAMAEHIDSLKKYAEGISTSYFSRVSTTTDAAVMSICKKYVVIFGSFIVLTEQAEETMIFSNLLRLRQELTKLIPRHTDRISDPVARATTQSTIYDSLLQGLMKSAHFTAHPKYQQEVAYWANLEEEARRKIISVNQARSRR